MGTKKLTCGDCQLIHKCNGYDDDNIDCDEMFRGIGETTCEKFTSWQNPKKHCSGCKHMFWSFWCGEPVIYECTKLLILLDAKEDINEDHEIIEDQGPDVFPGLYAEAMVACGEFEVQYGRPDWMDD